MQPKEPLEVRKEMVQMHDEYLTKLHTAMDNQEFIGAVWLCYAIFEQRINRLLDKILCKCPKEDRKDDKSAVISKRLDCIRKLIKENYGGFSGLDGELFSDILQWCDKRNELVHGLVSLTHYRQFETEFEDLANQGYKLVPRLYKECSKFREWYYNATDELPDFPYKGCKNKLKCIKQA